MSTTTILSLPEELILAILSKLSTQQLAECRLVYKHWDALAAKAMLSRRITIRSNLQAFQLYIHLSRDPSMAALVKHMRFKLDGQELPFAVQCLLQLIFNANIIKMTGHVESDTFFTTLFDIADRAPPSTFQQLKQLPTYTGKNSKITDRKYMTFKNTVRSFSLNIAGDALSAGRISWVDMFDQFPSLTKFTLSGAPNGLDDIESKLKNCHYLKHLYLHDLFYGGLTMHDMTKDQVATWLTTSHVQQETSLRSLYIEALCRPELIEYLLFKYPHVRDITIKGRLWFLGRSLRLVHDGMDRILDAIAKIRHKHITFVLPAH
ncbi:hypothetical protein V8B55DRAFT_1330758 [Mucor lusitanicus]|uniref:F-box domain-containing protein n=2 Tax=Mucor circinelloides f. lusitanicus TaxID=29924 RepID=A0A168MBN5_MUCCL|nr:hypothetical protein FB192DRAFT_1340056 [Mucor lusitanicus]OAD04681.1 hypothetical protein MUCCIDRAFT_161404 [Mucor lusitanicus CBS 277.49]